MKSRIRTIFLFLAIFCSLDTVSADAWTPDALAAALDAADRPVADVSRDAARRPAEVLAFLGVEPGMTVVDLMAAGGWYTEVLSVAVGPDGKVYAQNPTWMLEGRGGANAKAIAARLEDDRLPNVVRADGPLGDAGIDPGSVDLVFTALNFHDTYYMVGADAAADQLAAIYAVLKPGGVLGLVDHNGDPKQDNAKLHRIPRQIAIDMAKEAGFTLEAEGEMLAHPEDDLTKMVFLPETRGKTDRFVLRLRK